MRLSAIRSTVSALSLLVSAVLGLGAIASCGVEVSGTQQTNAPVSYIDDDGDGVSDGVDTNGDGESDFSIERCVACKPQGEVTCKVPLIDEDRDGLPDGLDTNCDGGIDVRFETTGAPSQVGNRCVANSTVNGTKFGVTCQGSGGSVTCECRRNDQLVTTCAQSSSSCSLSVQNGQVSAGCCQF